MFFFVLFCFVLFFFSNVVASPARGEDRTAVVARGSDATANKCQKKK